MISLVSTPAASWRDARGRFARLNAGDVLGRQLLSDSSGMLSTLRSATPVKTGAARANWAATYLPTSKELRISNSRGYVTFLITGTRHMPANPNLSAAVEQVKEQAAVSLHSAGVTISKELAER